MSGDKGGDAMERVMNDAISAAVEAVDKIKSDRKEGETVTETVTEALPEDATLAESETLAEAPIPSEALETVLAEAEEWKAKAYRTAADLENARRRFTREREELRKFGIEGLLKDLFPVLDNLERAIDHAPNADDPVVQGVKMVVSQFTTVLKNRGATPFDPAGEEFNPQLHEAMSQIPTTDCPPGHIAQVYQRGWMLHERLIRPAMVVVGIAPEITEE